MKSPDIPPMKEWMDMRLRACPERSTKFRLKDVLVRTPPDMVVEKVKPPRGEGVAAPPCPCVRSKGTLSDM